LELTINPEDQRTFGPCDCCGNLTERVWGYVYEDEIALAAYFVEWTPGHADRAANFDLIIGKWGSDAEAANRSAVALAFRHLPTGPAFMVIDAGDRPIAASSLVGAVLNREQVIGTPISQTAFAVCDAIYLKDHRISHLASEER